MYCKIHFFLFQDIRNFFGAKPKPGKVEDQPAAMNKKRPKPVVLSSDSDSDGGSKKSSDKPKKPVAKKPARQVLSDSGKFYILA